jgi:hypothetical protein
VLAGKQNVLAMRTKVKAALIVGVALTALACFTLGHHYRECHDPVSLTFQRYSDLDPYVGDVAFLYLTNASKRSCTLFMTGNTNTLAIDTIFGRFKQSLMVNCEFSDQTPHGWTNWIQQPSPFFKNNAYASLPPHAGIVVRVPLPPSGQSRKVAVLYLPDPPPWQLWLGSPRGQSVFTILVRMLPRSASSKLFRPQPLLRAWCGRALTNQWDGVRQQ